MAPNKSRDEEENKIIDRLSRAITNPLEMTDDEFLEVSQGYQRMYTHRQRPETQKFTPG